MAFKGLFDFMKSRLGGADPVPEARGLPGESVRLSNPWHAVTVQYGSKHCKAVEELAGQRFLSKEAPKLPLRGCTEPQCSCRYRKHEDRRHEGVPLDRNGMPLPHPKRRDTD